MVEKIKYLLLQFGLLSWPIKFAVSASLSAAAGGGILTFLIQNAAYNYALTFGFRPPVEGVPYLSAMVKFGSVSLLLIAAVLSVAFCYSFKDLFLFISKQVCSLAEKRPTLSKVLLFFRTLPGWGKLLLILGGAVYTAVFTTYFHYDAADKILSRYEICGWPMLMCVSNQTASLEEFLFNFSIGLCLFIAFFRPGLFWVSAALAIFTYYAWIGYNILPAEGYARLLRTIGFGGGSQVFVEFGKDGECKPAVMAYLLMRSETQVFIYHDKNQSIEERPLSQVCRISYGQGGLHNISYKLPPLVNLKQL